MNKNQEVVETMRKYGVYNWQVAQKLGVSEMTFIRWKREEFTEERKQKVMSAIMEIHNEKGVA